MVLPNASGSRGAPRDSLGVSAASRRGRCGAGWGRAGQGRGGRRGQAGWPLPALGLSSPLHGPGSEQGVCQCSTEGRRASVEK